MNEVVERDDPSQLPWAEFGSALAVQWKKVAIASLVAGAIGVALVVVAPKYEASGFYYTPGWSLQDYKRFRSEFGSADVLDAYLSEVGRGPEDAPAARLLLARSKASTFWATAVKPLYPITKKDAKELFESTKDKESLSIIGLDLAVEGSDPKATRDAVLLLGDYVTQTLQLTALQNWAVSGQTESNAEFLKAENQALRIRYSMEQTRQRIDELRALQAKYPESQLIASRQVVNVDAASSKFLSPIAQIVALEAGLAESNESLRRMERRVAQLRLEANFFNKAAEIAKSTREGRVLMTSFAAIKREVFEPLDNDHEQIREVSNRFDIELNGFKDQFSTGFGFRSAVLEPSTSKRSVFKVGAVAALLGLLLGLMLVWAPVLLRSTRDAAVPSRS